MEFTSARAARKTALNFYRIINWVKTPLLHI